MSEPARSVRAVCELAGAPSASAINSGKVATPRDGAARNEHGRSAEVADRREVARHLDREIGGRSGERHKRRESGDEKRVTIGHGTGCHAGRNGAASPRLVDGQDLLAQTWVSRSAMIRKVTSMALPGPELVMIFTGRAG